MKDLNTYTLAELMDMLPNAGSVIIEDHEDVAFQLEKTDAGQYRCWAYCRTSNTRVISMTDGRVDPDFTKNYPTQPVRDMLTWLWDCGYLKQ